MFPISSRTGTGRGSDGSLEENTPHMSLPGKSLKYEFVILSCKLFSFNSDLVPMFLFYYTRHTTKRLVVKYKSIIEHSWALSVLNINFSYNYLWCTATRCFFPMSSLNAQVWITNAAQVNTITFGIKWMLDASHLIWILQGIINYSLSFRNLRHTHPQLQHLNRDV